MSITLTRQDLQFMYLQFITQKKLTKLVEDEIDFIRTNIININNEGVKTYNITYAINFCENMDDFITLLVMKIKEIFIDSYITNEKRMINDIEKIFIGIDWTI